MLRRESLVCRDEEASEENSSSFIIKVFWKDQCILFTANTKNRLYSLVDGHTDEYSTGRAHKRAALLRRVAESNAGLCGKSLSEMSEFIRSAEDAMIQSHRYGQTFKCSLGVPPRMVDVEKICPFVVVLLENVERQQKTKTYKKDFAN